MYNLLGSIPLLFSALAAADLISFSISDEAYLGLYITIARASSTLLPLIASKTKHAFCTDTLAYDNFALGLVSLTAFLSLLIWDLCPFAMDYSLLSINGLYYLLFFSS